MRTAALSLGAAAPHSRWAKPNGHDKHLSRRGHRPDGRRVYLDTHGFTAEAIRFLVTCAGNIQDLPHREAYAAMTADRAVLARLVETRTNTAEHTWHLVRHVIWGDQAAANAGTAIIARAPKNLRPPVRGIVRRTAPEHLTACAERALPAGM